MLLLTITGLSFASSQSVVNASYDVEVGMNMNMNKMSTELIYVCSCLVHVNCFYRLRILRFIYFCYLY